jgi:prepilin-type N-terminal cleavage/methylation domain-containing protein
MRSARGFTIVEMMVAMAITGVLTAFVLTLTRTQLSSYEMQSQVASTQQGTRTGFDLVESYLRRVCAGAMSNAATNANGQVKIYNVNGLRTTKCLRIFDGAADDGAGRFTHSSPATLPDAIEVIFADGTANTVLTANASAGGTTLTVASITGFSTGDFLLIPSTTANAYKDSYLLQLSPTVAPSGTTLTLDSALPTGGAAFTPQVGFPVMHARAVSLYVDTALDPLSPYLMLDPDGPAGADHTDAQPLIEGVEDFQLAVGVDANGDGTLTEAAAGSQCVWPPDATDEWVGNCWTSGTKEIESLFATAATATPWAPTTSRLLAVRAGLTVRTLNQYAGHVPPVNPLEDRGTTSWTYAAAAATSGPRFRQLRMMVAPRTWSMGD